MQWEWQWEKKPRRTKIWAKKAHFPLIYREGLYQYVWFIIFSILPIFSLTRPSGPDQSSQSINQYNSKMQLRKDTLLYNPWSTGARVCEARPSSLLILSSLISILFWIFCAISNCFTISFSNNNVFQWFSSVSLVYEIQVMKWHMVSACMLHPTQMLSTYFQEFQTLMSRVLDLTLKITNFLVLRVIVQLVSHRKYGLLDSPDIEKGLHTLFVTDQLYFKGRIPTKKTANYPHFVDKCLTPPLIHIGRS